ncbi:hypothetical protein U91I_00354 [alpha proteobacterium U9-1i]|nr:hypothetical protein U91I_00354 [alpha proteobacterium U9-1i]
MFTIEDEAHAELQDGEFGTEQDAMTELRRRAAIPWNEEPNLAPCTNVLVEYDKTATPRRERSRRAILDISAEGVFWHT